MFEKLKQWYRWNLKPKPASSSIVYYHSGREMTAEETNRFKLSHSAYNAKNDARTALLGDYQRTPEHGPVYINTHGAKYGKRPYLFEPEWKDYTTVTYPERFDTLSDFVENLVDYLAEHFDVAVTTFDGTEPECSWVGRQSSVVYRLAPADPQAHTVWIAVNNGPFTIVSVKPTHATGRNIFHEPDCGCDACDESYESSAESIEDEVFNQIMGEPGGAHSWQRTSPIDNARPHST